MNYLVFAYGTLKDGFANFRVNAGQRIEGTFETVDRFPLYVIGEYCIPWLVDRAGEGRHIAGQVFDVGVSVLERMDELEMLGEPGWFTRRQILVRRQGTALEMTRSALAYFGAPEKLRTEFIHAGPISEFTQAHDAEYRKRAA